ncbi:MAG: acyltransferase [Muribaculaceae bacterium]|nr:acyltransferase [Muribaculaceae bacterium]
MTDTKDLNINTAVANAPEIPAEFQDIAPYNDSNFKDKLAALVREPGFEHAVRYVMPQVDYPAFVEQLLSITRQKDFQTQVMGAFLEMLVASTTDGLTVDGLENCEAGKSYTFISNHRDIVLDASFLNLCFIRNKMPITQVAIGNNLLIYDWITDLVKINRSFIVKRGDRLAKALENARQLSGYIHFTVNSLHESVWIAQREGRAKDSNDVTQESLLKMLALAGGGTVKHNLCGVSLLPVSISYEYDPNDYLKAREFLLKRRDPEYKKTQRDDLFSMETGITKPKGRIHFHLGACINARLEKLQSEDKAEVVRAAGNMIDHDIHSNYYIFPCNYIAYDTLLDRPRFADCYTAEDVEKFEKYITGQLDKVDVPDITPTEREFMRHLIMEMYANPLRNKLAACDSHI